MTRSSWQFVPMLGIGRDSGIANRSPSCSIRSRNPASLRASGEKGGDFTSPCIQTSGFGTTNNICHIRHIRKGPLTPN
jgi:hypothetical protein